MVYGMDQFSPFLPLAGEEEAGAMCSLWHTLMNIFLVDSGKRKDFITKPGYSGRNYYNYAHFRYAYLGMNVFHVNTTLLL